MNRRKLLKSSLAMVGGILIQQSLYAKKLVEKPQSGISEAGVQPFKVNFSKDSLKDLHKRLDNIKWPDIPFDTGWSAGTNDKVLRDLVKYWRNEYDWFKEQEKLNQLPHFKKSIEGEQLHFVHYKGSGKRQPYPLLLLHGWPSSFLEFSKVTPMLLNGLNGQEGFELVVPSLPGFVFSDAPKQPGLHNGKIAERLHILMQELGYNKYGVVGGDWGYGIGRRIAFRHPQSVVGFYTHIGGFLNPLDKKDLTPEEIEWKKNRDIHNEEGVAYYHVHKTKPQTLAYSLQDSPVGLLSWILEKYWAWSDHGEDIWQTFHKNDILNTVTLYWLSGKILSAARIYYEDYRAPAEEKKLMPVTVPTGYARYPKEPWSSLRSVFDTKLFPNVVHWSDMQKGGHFPALEQPGLYVKDVRTFFSKL